MPKRHWKCMGNITPWKVVFLTVDIFNILNFNSLWNFTISWNYQSGVLSICAGTNKARQRRSRSNLSIVSDVCHATDFIFFFLFPANYSMFWSTNTQRFLSLYNYLPRVRVLTYKLNQKLTSYLLSFFI